MGSSAGARQQTHNQINRSGEPGDSNQGQAGTRRAHGPSTTRATSARQSPAAKELIQSMLLNPYGDNTTYQPDARQFEYENRHENGPTRRGSPERCHGIRIQEIQDKAKQNG